MFQRGFLLVFLLHCCLLTRAEAKWTASSKAYDIIKFFEQSGKVALVAYHGAADKADVWTIGWGNTIYANGKKVKKGDTITAAAADALLKYWVEKNTAGIESAIGSTAINQNQFDALTSWTYNFSPSQLKSSTLLKLIKANPNDPKIRDEFMKWVNSNGKVQPGLVKRRTAEADLYFSK